MLQPAVGSKHNVTRTFSIKLNCIMPYSHQVNPLKWIKFIFTLGNWCRCFTFSHWEFLVSCFLMKNQARDRVCHLTIYNSYGHMEIHLEIMPRLPGKDLKSIPSKSACYCCRSRASTLALFQVKRQKSKNVSEKSPSVEMMHLSVEVVCWVDSKVLVWYP